MKYALFFIVLISISINLFCKSNSGKIDLTDQIRTDSNINIVKYSYVKFYDDSIKVPVSRAFWLERKLIIDIQYNGLEYYNLIKSEINLNSQITNQMDRIFKKREMALNAVNQ